MNAANRAERGATLIIALIMLAVISLLAVSTLGTTNMNLKVVGNMQSREEALNAAQQAIETVISTPRFIGNPDNAVPDPCGAANTLCTDLDGDGTPEYITRLVPAPSCVAVRVIKASELNLASAEDLSCAAGPGRPPGLPVGDSLCARTEWEITAESRATYSRTKVTVTQGVAVRVSAADAQALCSAAGGGPPGAGRMVRTGGLGNSAGGPGAGPVITQRRVRTYWYVHGDE